MSRNRIQKTLLAVVHYRCHILLSCLYTEVKYSWGLFVLYFSGKTEVFLEVFGNSEIRKETEETLRHAAAQLSLSVTNTLSSDSLS